jgi:dissimilatory sulfite reductase related protein
LPSSINVYVPFLNGLRTFQSGAPGVGGYYATLEGIEGQLTEDHWKLINYIRDYYAKFGIAPMVRKITKDTGYTLKRIYELFPSGPAKGTCKLAGLSKPTGCV